MKIVADADFLHEEEPGGTYTVVDAAVALEVGEQAIRNYIAQGKLPHVRRAHMARNAPFVIPECCLRNFERVRDEKTQVVVLPEPALPEDIEIV